MARAESRGARSRARELLVQALYQMQITGHGRSELMAQFRERPEYQRVDQDYFDEALRGILDQQLELDELLSELADRPTSQLDPVERGILMLGLYELRLQLEVPFRVIINEAVNLAKRFGALDGHKYVNAVLDRAAAKVRPPQNNG
ncbi:MAG: transcription antitermination factor NusB [Woeseiaceae bacterium]